MRARDPSTRSAESVAIMPRMSEARRDAASLPYPRAERTRRAIASSSIAASSVSGSPSSRSCVCCAISSDQLTACASSVPPDPNRSPSTKSSGNGKSFGHAVCLSIPSRTSCVRFSPGSS